MRQTPQPRVIQKRKPQKLWLQKPVGVAVAGETPSLTGECIGETHRVLECTQTHPPKNQRKKGPICLYVAGEVTESQRRATQVALFPLRPLPKYSATIRKRGLPRPGKYLRVCPLKRNRCTQTKKYGPNERTDQNSRKNTSKQ